MADVHNHGATVANCSATCEASGHGVCVWDDALERTVCECTNGWARADMHIWNQPITCPVPMAAQGVISCVMMLGSIAVFVWALRFTLANPAMRKLGAQLCIASLLHASYDATRIATLERSAWSTISFIVVVINAVHFSRVNINELALEAYNVFQKDPTKLESFIIIFSRMTASADAIVDTLCSVILMARIYGINAAGLMLRDAYNECSIFALNMSALCNLVLAVSFHTFNARTKTLVAEGARDEDTQRKYSTLLEGFAAVRIGINVATVCTFAMGGFLTYRYSIVQEDVEFMWLLDLLAQGGTLNTLVDTCQVFKTLAKVRTTHDDSW